MRLVLCLGAGALILTSAGSAQSPDRRMTTIWTIEPADSPRPSVEAAAGDILWKQRLLPTGLVRLSAPYQDAGGKRSFGAGTQLFEVKSDVPVYCVAGMRDPKGFEKWLKSGSTTQFCLVDLDSDLRFDGYFEPISMVPGLPTIAGKRPKNPKPMSPVSYELIDPSSMEKPFWVGIQYQGKPLLYDRRNFAISFGSDTGKGSLTSWVYTSGSDYPLSQELLGARFTVLGMSGDKLQVRIDEPIPAQPFGVAYSVTYRIY